MGWLGSRAGGRNFSLLDGEYMLRSILVLPMRVFLITEQVTK